MKIKTQDLTGRLLDYAAAVALGGTDFSYDTISTWWITIDGKDHALSSGWAQSFEPSTNPAQGQPILERERLHFNPIVLNGVDAWEVWYTPESGCSRVSFYGSTMLAAGLRCFVAKYIGYEVEVSDEFANSVR